MKSPCSDDVRSVTSVDSQSVDSVLRCQSTDCEEEEEEEEEACASARVLHAGRSLMCYDDWSMRLPEEASTR